MNLSRILRYLTASLSLALLLLPALARAQLEVGVMGIYQNGKEVGRIYVPNRGAKDETYVEHWVLFPGYVYPSKHRPGLETLIVPLEESAESLADFKKNQAAQPGVRFVEVLSHETELK